MQPLCDCAERPRCEWEAGYWSWSIDAGAIRGTCGEPATWTAYQPAWDRRLARFIFLCAYHGELYRDAMENPIPGIDKPERASDLWKPSLTESIRLACLRLNDEERRKEEREGRTAQPLGEDRVMATYWERRYDKRRLTHKQRQAHRFLRKRTLENRTA